MRTLPAALAALVLAACAAPPPSEEPLPSVFPLANAGFEEPWPDTVCAPRWTCSMHRDPKSFRFFPGESTRGGGKASLCFEPVKREPWALVMQGTFDKRLRGKRLRFSLDVRTEGVTGKGGGAEVRVHGALGKSILIEPKRLTGTHDWETLTIDFAVSPQATEVEVGGVLDGRGRVCIDNARLEVLP